MKTFVGSLGDAESGIGKVWCGLGVLVETIVWSV